MQNKVNNKMKSSVHSKYKAQAHIVLAPKYRRKAIYGQIKRCWRDNTKNLTEQKNIFKRLAFIYIIVSAEN